MRTGTIYSCTSPHRATRGVCAGRPTRARVGPRASRSRAALRSFDGVARLRFARSRSDFASTRGRSGSFGPRRLISGPRPPTDAARMGLDPSCETTPSPPAPETPADDSGAARGGFWGEGGLVRSLSGKVGGWFSAPERDLAARARDVATLTERHPGCDADLARRFLAAREPPRVPDRRHDRAPTRAISCRLYYTAPFFLSSLPTSDHALTHSDSLVPLRPLRAGSAS